MPGIDASPSTTGRPDHIHLVTLTPSWLLPAFTGIASKDIPKTDNTPLARTNASHNDQPPATGHTCTREESAQVHSTGRGNPHALRLATLTPSWLLLALTGIASQDIHKTDNTPLARLTQPPPTTSIETRSQREQSQVRSTGRPAPATRANEPAAPPVHAAAAARRRSVRLKRTNLRVRGLSLNRSQQWTALLRTTPRLRTRSSTNDLAPLHRM